MDAREHNKQYLDLNDEQYDKHCKLMQSKMVDWPDDLWEYAKGVTEQIGACGDVFACAVADWLKRKERANETLQINR